MGGYKRKNNPNKTHYRKGTTPKKGKPYTISQRDLERTSFSQDYDDDRIKEQQGTSKAIPMGNKYFADTERYLDKKSETDLSGTKTNEGSPSKFLNVLGGIKAGGALIKGIKNRDEFGGGLKGALKGTGDALTSGGLIGKIKDGIEGRNEEINSKLDTIIAAVGGGDDTMAPDISTTSPGAAPLAMASPARFTEFMNTPQQAPVSNNTGGKNPTFAPTQADRMMAVADPDVDTKGALFMKGGEKDNMVSVKPYAETKGTNPITGYKKNKAGVKVNLANLPVNLKVGFEQKNKGYKSSISPSVVIGGKIKLKGKKQEKPKFT